MARNVTICASFMVRRHVPDVKNLIGVYHATRQRTHTASMPEQAAFDRRGRGKITESMSAVAPIAWIILATAVTSAVVHLYAEYHALTRLVYIAKPCTTSLLVIMALVANTPERTYQVPIVIGLCLSLVGDMFLMLRGNYFIAGLASFLAAHLAYIVAFRSGVGFGRHAWLLLPYLLLATGVLVYLWPRLGRLRPPVVAYVAALVVMAWQAAVRANVITSVFTLAAAVGAALFVVSDGVLAINRFGVRFRAAQAVIMSTYVVAQALIALSVWHSAG